MTLLLDRYLNYYPENVNLLKTESPGARKTHVE